MRKFMLTRRTFASPAGVSSVSEAIFENPRPRRRIPSSRLPSLWGYRWDVERLDVTDTSTGLPVEPAQFAYGFVRARGTVARRRDLRPENRRYIPRSRSIWGFDTWRTWDGIPEGCATMRREPVKSFAHSFRLDGTPSRFYSGEEARGIFVRGIRFDAGAAVRERERERYAEEGLPVRF